MQWNNKYIYPNSTRSIFPGSRHYRVNQENLPSVTTILKATESVEKFKAITDAHEADDKKAVADARTK